MDGRTVCVELNDTTRVYGILYAVDPENKSIIIIQEYDDCIVARVVFQHAICSITEDESGPTLEDLALKFPKTTASIATIDLQQVQDILRGNRISYELEKNTFHLWNGAARIDPPYTRSNISTDNEMMLQRLLELFPI